jgi:hypothetical protein
MSAKRASLRPTQSAILEPADGLLRYTLQISDVVPRHSVAVLRTGPDFMPTEAAMAPAMTANEVACYVRYLKAATAVLEYGVGGSTVLAAECGVRSLYSIDSDADWVAKVAAHPSVAGMVSAGRAKLVHADIGPVGAWGWPLSYRYIVRWPRYASRLWSDRFKPDLVLVDGRFRVSCIMTALRHGAPGLKIAVHDFRDPARYHRFERALRFATIIEETDTLVVLKRYDGPGSSSSGRCRLLAWRHKFDRH